MRAGCSCAPISFIWLNSSFLFHRLVNAESGASSTCDFLTTTMPSSSSGPMPPDGPCPADGQPVASALGDAAEAGQAAVVDIVADVRERPSATFAMLASRSDVALTEATLKFGDYSVAAHVSFERKTAEDLGRSIIDGRLFRQTSVLRSRVERPILLVEGLEPAGSPAGVSWHTVRGALVSVAAVFAVPILYFRDAQESADVMVTAARQLRRARSTAYCRPGYRPKGWRKRVLLILQGLPQIGPRRAPALARRCARAVGLTACASKSGYARPAQQPRRDECRARYCAGEPRARSAGGQRTGGRERPCE